MSSLLTVNTTSSFSRQIYGLDGKYSTTHWNLFNERERLGVKEVDMFTVKSPRGSSNRKNHGNAGGPTDPTCRHIFSSIPPKILEGPCLLLRRQLSPGLSRG